MPRDPRAIRGPQPSPARPGGGGGSGAGPVPLHGARPRALGRQAFGPAATYPRRPLPAPPPPPYLPPPTPLQPLAGPRRPRNQPDYAPSASRIRLLLPGPSLPPGGGRGAQARGAAPKRVLRPGFLEGGGCGAARAAAFPRALYGRLKPLAGAG